MISATHRIMHHLYDGIAVSGLPESRRLESTLHLADTPTATVHHLMRNFKKPGHKVFYDLSSGIGNVVLQLAHFNDPQVMGYNPALGFFTKTVGVETAQDKIRIATRALEKAINLRRLISQVSFENKDPREIPLSDADMIYLNTPALDPVVGTDLTGNFYHLRPGARIIMVDRMLNQQYFKLVDSVELTVNRHPSFVFVYDKK